MRNNFETRFRKNGCFSVQSSKNLKCYIINQIFVIFKWYPDVVKDCKVHDDDDDDDVMNDVKAVGAQFRPSLFSIPTHLDL